VTAGPGDKPVTGKSRDRGRLRASDSEREQVAGALQAAFVQGRLTQEELSARAEQTYAAKTYADLTEVIADLPTELTGTISQRAPWRATKGAWWFEYAAFLPGIVAIIALPNGPGTTIRTLIVFAAVIYPVFWTLGVLKAVASRHAKPAAEQQAAQLPWHEREQATGALKAALAQGRLTEEEHDARAAQVPAARLGADLDALTADLPDGLNARLPKARDAWTGLAVIIAAAGVLALMLLSQFDDFLAFAAALLTAAILLLAPPITVGLMIDARHQKRAGGQLRLGPASGPGS
jgi:Domain of unknown function (DUF1707)